MNYYAILGLTRDARQADVERAYRRLARRYHPNLNPGDDEARVRFREIVRAYEVLGDPVRRREYDVSGRHHVEPSTEAKFAFERFDFSMSAVGTAASTFGELFSDALGPAPGTRAPERGEDLHVEVAVPFEAAFSGATEQITVTRRDACDPCHGTGRIATTAAPCGTCDGTGVVRGARSHMVFSKRCTACGGEGIRRLAPCPVCRGDGVVVRTDAVTVHLAPGVAEGDEVTLAGAGNSGRFGGSRGDLRVRVRMTDHRFFRREGDDVVVEVPVTVYEAALGARVSIPTPDGRSSLRLPPGTEAGRRFRLRERGVPSLRTGRRGDLIAEIRLVLPALADERSRELMRELAALNPVDVRAHFADRNESVSKDGEPQW